MNQLTERKRLRREYLRKKGYGLLGTTILCTVSFVGVFYFIFSMNTNGILKAGLGGLFFGVCLACIQEGIKRAKRTTAIPYVPPVVTSTLPAEEILVRAADEPPVEQSSILLRAAQAGKETAKEELLRVSQGE